MARNMTRYIDVFFEDAAEWLIGAFALHCRISSLAFDIDEVVNGKAAFLWL